MIKFDASKQRHVLKTGAIYGVPVVLCVVLLIILNMTSPLQTGPAGILLVFGLLYLTLTTFTFALLQASIMILSLFGVQKYKITRRSYYITSVVTLWPIFILALNTLGRLELTEVILVTLLVSLCCFYVSRRDETKSHS